MRRLLAVGLLLGAAVAARRMVATRAAGTPASWPPVPRKPPD
ncbi:MAG: hypothetical protein ACRDY3_08475 [Acidimicrobiales bacterium]